MKSIEACNVTSNDITKVGRSIWENTCPFLLYPKTKNNFYNILPSIFLQYPKIKNINICHYDLLEIACDYKHQDQSYCIL